MCVSLLPVHPLLLLGDSEYRGIAVSGVFCASGEGIDHTSIPFGGVSARVRGSGGLLQ